jgi:radical SAM superfamily enzyme YgiQ (UPF0313 family)
MAKSSGKPHALLIFPPVYDFALFDLFLRPYALLKLGRWLEKAGYTVTLINALDYREANLRQGEKKPKRKPDGTGKFYRRVISKPQVFSSLPRFYARYGIAEQVLEEKIKNVHPDIILITSGMTYWYQGVKEMAELVKKIHARVPVVVGGIYASLCPAHAQRILKADAIIVGNAYPSLCDLLSKMNLPAPESPPAEEYLSDPDYYYDACAVRLNSGCVFNCSYCASSLLAGEFRPGQPLQLVRLIKKINTDFGINSFAFYDDALLAHKEAAIIPFLEQIIAAKRSINFFAPNGLHIAFLDPVTAGLMKKAGFKEVRLGFESSSPHFHTTHGFKHNVSMLGQGVEALKSGGYNPSEIAVYVLAGLPGQHPEEVEQSIHYAASFGIKVFVAEYSPIPGTELWEECVKHSSFPLAEEPLTHNNTLFALQSEEFSLRDLDRLKTMARNLRQELAKN